MTDSIRKESHKFRPIHVKMFGKEYGLLDAFPKELATDMITIVESFRRKRQCSLSIERLEAVEKALREQDCSLEQIRGKIEEIRKEAADNFDANSYYDINRVSAYTNEFIEVQNKHTSRCVYMLPDISHSILLDLGCGSGLSTQRLCGTKETSTTFVVGVDASQAMLSAAKQNQESSALNNYQMTDFVLADFNVRLPFRKDAFDQSSSTSAVHYVRPNNRQSFLLDIFNVVRGDNAFQVFPKDGIQELGSFVNNSPFPSNLIVIDKPHHKDPRYYLLFSKSSECIKNSLCKCNLFGMEEIPSDIVQSCRCLLSFPRREGILESGHLEWLEREHERCKKREERVKRRQLELEQLGSKEKYPDATTVMPKRRKT